MNKPRYTAEDVARAAGVSIMTVSRAMSGKPGVGADTKEKIIRTAKLLGYSPSKAARALALRRSSSLGLVMPDMANPFFAILAKAAIDVARTAGKSVFVMNTDEDPRIELEAIEELRSEEIEGVIVAGSRLSDKKLVEAVAPFRAAVLVNRDYSGKHIGSVYVDYRSGATEAVEYLASRSRVRIGLLDGPRVSAGSRLRLAGYRDGLKRLGLPLDERLVARCVPTIEGGEEATRELLERAPDLDAILAYNDMTAIGVLRLLEELGRSVPGGVAVIGTDNIPYAALVRPALSTMAVDIPRLGSSAMSLLLALTEGDNAKGPPPQIPRIVIRESA